MTKDMTTGSPFKTLFAFAMPMVIGNIFQQLYNIVDSMVVGNFVGSDALAAVGASASITFLFIAIAVGAGMGCSVVISQLFGANKLNTMKTAIYTSLITMFVISLLLTVVGILVNNSILRLMRTPENIFNDSATYLRIYFFGLVFLFMYNILNSIFNALGDSKIPLYFLILSSAINVILDLYFVIGLGLGVAGVAWATLIAQGTSAVLSFVTLFIRLKRIKSEEPVVYFSLDLLKRMGAIAVPSTIQQSIVSLGMIFVQSLVNSYGSIVVAGYTAATKIDSIAIMPMVNVGNAVSTFTAQNIGAQKPERIGKGLAAGLKIAGAIAITITIALYLYGEVFISAFVDTNSNPGVIAVGVEYLKVVSVFYVLMGAMNITNGILRGAGDVKVFMISTMCNFTSRVVIAYLLSMVIGFKAIWWAVPIGWLVSFIISFTRFKSGKWKTQGIVVK